MPILGRPTLKRYFESGRGLSNQALVALIDSAPNLLDTSTQAFPDLIVPQAIASGVSAGEANFTQSFLASAATFTGLITHGASAAIGRPVVSQEASVLATGRVALFPGTVNITGFQVAVLAASSGGAGGTEIRVGNETIDYFGTITVSAPGVYNVSNVSARRCQQTSGAVFMAAITASANANFIGRVFYCPTTAAGAGTISLVEVTALGSAIGNLNGLSLAFDGDTGGGVGTNAAITSAKGFVGQAWTASKRIGQLAIWDSNSTTWDDTTGNVTIRLYGNTSNNINTATILASVQAAPVTPNTVVTVAQSDIITTNAYPYHWAHISGAAAGVIRVAEVKFWELL